MTAVEARDERERLAALAACAIMDTPRESAFDNLVFTAAQLFRVPMAMLTLVGDTRVWVKSCVGPLPREWDRSNSFCHMVVESDQLLIVEDATTDSRFARTPGVMEPPHIRFCASAPLHGPSQHVIGALCVVDLHPRSVPDRQKTQLQQLAREAGELLRMRVPNLDLSA